MCFFFQAEDGIRGRSPSRGLGDVYKGQDLGRKILALLAKNARMPVKEIAEQVALTSPCPLTTSAAADGRPSVDLGGRRILKKKTQNTENSNATI